MNTTQVFAVMFHTLTASITMVPWHASSGCHLPWHSCIQKENALTWLRPEGKCPDTMRPEGKCPVTLHPVSRYHGELCPDVWCHRILRLNSHCLFNLRWEWYMDWQGTSRASRVPGTSGRSLCVRTHIFFPDVFFLLCHKVASHQSL